MSLAFFVCVVVTLVSAVVSLGFSLVAVWSSEGTERDVALYATVRSFAFLVQALVPWLSGSVSWLLAAGWGMTIVQGLDAGIGRRMKDSIRTYGPAAIGVVNMVAVVWLMLKGY